jgi:two-component system chemotaxis response regulator CheB
MKLRVLVADDSLFMRAAVRRLLERDGRFEVIGEAKDGRDAVGKLLTLAPDVCTMDFNMPILDGVGAVREIMRQRPTPVVMLSAHTREGARETFDALAAGAVDFVTKPAGEVSTDLGAVGEVLIAKLLAAANAVPRAMGHLQLQPRAASITGTRAISIAGPRVAIVAVSTGGPAALGRVLPAFPGDTSLALVVVQHLPAGFTAALAERLDALCAVRVREAKSGDRPESGLALIAPGDQHLDFIEQGPLKGSIRIFDGPEVNGVRPSADVTMISAARTFGRRAIGVVMTGMGKDGSDGVRAIKGSGGATLAQDQASCVIGGMPRAAIETGCVDKVALLDELADAIRRS